MLRLICFTESVLPWRIYFHLHKSHLSKYTEVNLTLLEQINYYDTDICLQSCATPMLNLHFRLWNLVPTLSKLVLFHSFL